MVGATEGITIAVAMPARICDEHTQSARPRVQERHTGRHRKAHTQAAFTVHMCVTSRGAVEPRVWESPLRGDCNSLSPATHLASQMMLAARKAVAALQKPTLAVDEATAYFSTPNAPLTTKLLAYWKAEEHRHPALAAMARDFLAVPATSASSERAFSFARHTVTEFRAGLSPETIRALLCLKSWLKIPQADMQDDELSDDEEEEVEEEGEDGTGEGEDEVEGDGEDEGGEDEEGGSMEDIMDVDRFFIDPNDESKVILDLVPDSDDDEY